MFRRSFAEGRQKAVLALAKADSALHSDLQVIATARDHVTRPRALLLPRVQIAEFDEPRIRDLVAQQLRF